MRYTILEINMAKLIIFRYMLTNNIDTSDGLVNGASGVLKKIDFKENAAKVKVPVTIWIDINNKKIGKNARSKRNCAEQTLTPISLCSKTFQYKNKMDIKITRYQFPVVPAEGLTIYKAQGSKYS